MQKKKDPSKGYVVVATKRQAFLAAAQNLAEGILDYDLNAKITLFAQKSWVEDPEYKKYFAPFDQVIVTPGDTARQKMWGMAKSPYDQTFYMDSDIEIAHKDILNVFDHLEDNDLVFTELTREASPAFVEWDWGPNHLADGWKGAPDHLSACGGVCLYNFKNPLVKDFMMDWFFLFHAQREGSWSPKEFDCIKTGNFRQWDQLTLWWLLYHSPKYKSLKWKFFDDNFRWNYFAIFGLMDPPSNYKKLDPRRTYSDGPVCFHHSAKMKKDFII